MMEMVTISTKGQVVIPKKIRDEMKLDGGTKMYISAENGEIIFRKPNKTIWELAGSIEGQGFSPEEEKEAAMEEAARHALGEDCEV